MERYTIGIYFKPDLKEVLLILKNRPQWQKGLYNFPGGHVEPNETGRQCVSREFKEECNLITPTVSWVHIGNLKNNKHYFMYIYTALHNEKYGEARMNEDQPIEWVCVNNMPDNIIDNLTWLIPLAKCYWSPGKNMDRLKFSTFAYGYW